METLKNYLENMFLNLPNTPEVRKAKSELLQMMEDKYTELKNEGKAENEAIGIVISEFGNLDELAEDLGIKTYVEEEIAPEEMLSLDDAKTYLKDTIKRSSLIATGVLLCILSVVPVIFLTLYLLLTIPDLIQMLQMHWEFFLCSCSLQLQLHSLSLQAP